MNFTSGLEQGTPRRDELAANLADVQARITGACWAAGRPSMDVAMVAVSKTWPITDIAMLADLGVADMGENRDQEAAPKAAALPGVRWHFLGALQTNKARRVAAYADVVHSVDRLELVVPLSRGATERGRQVDVLIQIRLADGPGRAGALPAEVPALADAIAAAGGLTLRGVMAVAPLGGHARPAFDRLVAVALALRSDHPQAVIISAGMSSDLEDAVAAGSTLVRVGSALFGRRGPAVG